MTAPNYKIYDEKFGAFWSKVVELAPKLAELGPAAVNATDAFDNGDSPAEAVRLFEMTGSLA